MEERGDAVTVDGHDETDEVVEAGKTPPYIQGGMVLEHRDGSRRLKVVCIEGFHAQVAVCRSSGFLERVSVPCADIYRDYVLAVEFVP